MPRCGFLLPAEELTQRKKLGRHINWGTHLPSSRPEILG